jgi:putative endonuclease
MQDEGTLVFIEVRYRKHAFYGSAIESVTRQKQRRIIHSAEVYIQQKTPKVSAYRFDVVDISPEQSPLWLKNAFSVN